MLHKRVTLGQALRVQNQFIQRIMILALIHEATLEIADDIQTILDDDVPFYVQICVQCLKNQQQMCNASFIG